MATFGGDEVGAVVLDIGTSSLRAGYAGEDAPFHIVPSTVAFLKDNQQASESTDMDVDSTSAGGGEATRVTGAPKQRKGHKPCSAMVPVRDSFDIRKPVEDRLVSDWEGLEVLLDHVYEEELRTSSEEHPLLVTEASWNSTANRERMCELAFEKYKVPAFYVAKQAVCTSFSTARPTSLVVDVSESGTSVVPVYDGYVLTSSIVRNNIGGRVIRSLYQDALTNKLNVKLVPTYQVQTKKQVKEGAEARYTKRTLPFPVAPAYHDLAVDKIVQDFTLEVAKVSPLAYEEATLTQVPYEEYEFPNGFHKGFGLERFRTTEALFNPAKFAPEELRGSEDAAAKGVVDMIVESIQKCDTDVRQTLYGNIILSGGCSLTNGFVERVNNELEIKALSGGRFKVHAPTSTVERRNANWIGGSILGSLGTFQQMWISHEEYTETGRSVVGTKCS